MKHWVLYICLFLLPVSLLQAQELNMKVTINSNVQSSNPELFTALENSVKQLFNEQKWTDATFSRTERIDCAITITITQMPDESSFGGDIQISSRRPVYNSAYITPLINYRDTKFEFLYLKGQSLDYNSVIVDNNLVATIAFYSYVIIGLDFDSFSLNGGRTYFDKAMEIANMAQTIQGGVGWEPFSGNNNRYDLAVALTDESSKDFHTMWYNYHRLGLDEMSANPARARIRVLESISDLQKLHATRPSSILLALFSETKLDELIKIASQSTREEKQALKKTLIQMFPTKGNTINLLQ